MIELNVNIVELRELRKALGQQIRTIDCVAEERRYQIIGELYDKIVDLENEYDEERDLQDAKECEMWDEE